MSASVVVMREQNDNLERQIDMVIGQIAELPKGVIVYKHINGRKYPYRAFREEAKVVTVYIKKIEFEEVERKVERRKLLEERIKSLKREKRAIEAFLEVFED